MDAVRPGRSCPNCRILLNSGRCPKCRKKQAIGKNLAGRRRGI